MHADQDHCMRYFIPTVTIQEATAEKTFFAFTQTKVFERDMRIKKVDGGILNPMHMCKSTFEEKSSEYFVRAPHT